MHDLGAAFSEIIERLAHVNNIKSIIIVVDDNSTRPDDGLRQTPIVQDRCTAMISIDEYGVASRKIIGIQIERPASFQNEFKSRIGER